VTIDTPSPILDRVTLSYTGGRSGTSRTDTTPGRSRTRGVWCGIARYLVICVPWDDVAVVNYMVVDGVDEVTRLLPAARQDALNTGQNVPGLRARGLILDDLWM
jgi:hypothetical protein